MKTIAHTVKIVKNVKIFEKNDLIGFLDKQKNCWRYGIVLADQNPMRPDDVYVFDISQAENVTWTGIRRDNSIHPLYKFITHLENPLIPVS